MNIDAFIESAVEAELTMPEVLAELRLGSDAASARRALIFLRRLVWLKLADLRWRDWPNDMGELATEEDAESGLLDPEPLRPRHVVVHLTALGRQQALKRQHRQWRRAMARRGGGVEIDGAASG